MSTQHHGTGVHLALFDYTGADYRGQPLHPMRCPGTGPGWYLYGVRPGASCTVLHKVARPDVRPRAHPHYNIRVRRGWATKREALAVAQALAGGAS